MQTWMNSTWQICYSDISSKNIINDRMTLGKFFNFAELLFSYL